ncbi:MAG: LysM domain-containing protein [Pseudomonadota bacterium]
MSKQYTVQKGDSLTAIARDNGVTPRELAQANGISNPDFIKVGQQLRIPVAPSHSVPVFTYASAEDAQSEYSRILALTFVDAAHQPIDALGVEVHIDGEVVKHKTDSAGNVPAISVDKGAQIQVHVEKVGGGTKKVSELKIDSDATHMLLASPKIKLASELKVHEGPAQTAPTDKPAPQPVGTETLTRSANGNPVHAVAMECPNPENLRLQANFKYRDLVIAAAKRIDIAPQAVAAIMNAEAATISTTTYIPKINRKTGKPLIGKDGQPLQTELVQNDGEWDTRSAAKKSSARGMTQFLDGSWIELALTNGTFLNDRVTKEGWLTKTKIQEKHGKKIIEREVPAFKLANGTLATATKQHSLSQVLSAKPYITAYAEATDAHLQKLLDLRYEPEYAINTAVDYGKINLRGLTAAGFLVDGLNDPDRAKLIYLTHHLGLGDAKDFIRNRMSAKHAEYILKLQIKDAPAENLAKNEHGDYLKAHRKWLLNYIDKKIDLVPKMCDKSKATPARPLLAITEAIAPKT